ncbi:MAG: hypothetical protein METHAR1v1_310014 [Methanothrix sp.]|nr:MAG: hypothetical protein METHAR1v1_310014 [Methanothrix sp.]
MPQHPSRAALITNNPVDNLRLGPVSDWRWSAANPFQATFPQKNKKQIMIWYEFNRKLYY